ncbi:MAG: hypothetical protein KDH19_06910 [Geminicoccaceae bacterium]|nr:hypothetical protein [Geminicoccaceae bacterium]
MSTCDPDDISEHEEGCVMPAINFILILLLFWMLADRPGFDELDKLAGRVGKIELVIELEGRFGGD